MILTYYGKLPAFGDFVRYNATGPEFQLLDQWLQEAIYKTRKRLGSDFNTTIDRMPIYYFFLYFRGSTNYITGILKPSHDRVGRKYPFIIALTGQESLYNTAKKYFLPIVFQTFYREASIFAKRASSITTVEELTVGIQNLDTFIDDNSEAVTEYERYLKNTAVYEFFYTLFGKDDSKKKYLLVKNIRKMREYFEKGTIHVLGLGLCFPLPPEPNEPCITASMWLSYAFQLNNLENIKPFIFWGAHQTVKYSNMFVFYSQPVPDLYTLMVHPHLDSDLIYKMDIDTILTGNSKSEELPTILTDMINSGDASLESFFQTILSA